MASYCTTYIETGLLTIVSTADGFRVEERDTLGGFVGWVPCESLQDAKEYIEERAA